MIEQSIEQYLTVRRQMVENALIEVSEAFQKKSPDVLGKAIRYSLLAKGKRLRPLLALATCESLGGSCQGIEPLLCALEMVHTYSLIQDDLPCMDDDDFRRGIPSCHKVFGEGMALLASDTLLTEAFGLLANLSLTPTQNLMLIQELVSAIGISGMISGQVLDITYQESDMNHLYEIHQKKTGALFRAAVRMGALFANASSDELVLLTTYGEKLGLAFQFIDDLNDQSKEGEPSFAFFLSEEELKIQARLLVEQAKEAVQNIGKNMNVLSSLAESILPL